MTEPLVTTRFLNPGARVTVNFAIGGQSRCERLGVGDYTVEAQAQIVLRGGFTTVRSPAIRLGIRE
jgi:hypothetical protein